MLSPLNGDPLLFSMLSVQWLGYLLFWLRHVSIELVGMLLPVSSPHSAAVYLI